MKIIYLGLPGTGKHKCAWTLNLLGIDVVHDYSKNHVFEGRQPRSMQCMMDTNTLLNWEEAG